MRVRTKGICKSAVGNSRLTDFAELREAVLYHAQVVSKLPAVRTKQHNAEQSLAMFE